MKGRIHKFIESLFLSSNLKVQTTPHLNPFTLKFNGDDSHLESGYFDFFKTTFQRQSQFSHIVAIFFYSIFSFLDIVLIPEFADVFIFIRFGIVIPFISFILYLTTRENFHQYSQALMSASILVAGGGIIAMIAIGGAEINSLYYAGLILVFIFAFTFMGLKYRLALLTTWLLVLSYEIVSIYIGLPWVLFISNNFFFISTLIFTMIAGYSIEFYRRSEFFLFNLLELEKTKISLNNSELENRIIERTSELIEAKEKAENTDKMKSIFLAQMSHEIRTPINALVSMSSLLKYDFEEKADEDQLMSFDIIERAGGRIIRTVDLLLNLSEIQAGTYEISPTKFDLFSDVLSQILAENRKLAEKKNIKISLTNRKVDTELVSDLYTVHQIFTQIIDNAIKYTEEGKININILRNDLHQLVVEIKDTGVGIDESYLHKLFEPFSQEEMGYTRKFEGNGIGLTLVKKYCELNNATIEVESEKGIGSSFRIIFN